MNYSKKLANKVGILLIRCYRATFSPSVGVFRYLPFYPRPTCVFYPTCSQYGIECFQKYPFSTALQKTISRIGRCHPGTDPSIDLP